ncbi:class I adenylate-forming enzyme family protein [Algihabitans albus]|uniref:class I adenylate-forming enzyme family protein n=1 Tax=Algihabitans albus TaxID=2164067 RepID=UPI000E5C6D7F|nr:class I adenylate-forming enzyme family protein [Algihabitans albus]
MVTPEEPVPATRREGHFGDRVVTCFAERPASFDAMFRSAVEAHPDRDAVVDGSRRLSFAELDRLVSATAAGYRDLGLEPGCRLGLLIANRWQFLVALLAAVRADLIAVPLSVRAQTLELAYILNDCGARGLVYESGLAGRVPAPDAVPELTLRIGLEGRCDGVDGSSVDSGGATVTFESLLAGAGSSTTAAVGGEEDTAVILYTSGTTGHPKGAMLSHLNIVHSCLHYRHCFRLGPDDRAMLAVPASHVTGLIACIMAPLSAGGAVIVLETFAVPEFLSLAAREAMTMTVMVPAMYKLCLLRANLPDYDLSAWRVGAYGGAPMPPATIAALADTLPRLALANAYGATETTSPTTVMPLGDKAARSDSVGRSLPCAEVRVMDDDGCEVDRGETGEVWIGGPMVVAGYWNNPQATRDSFVGGFWRSGDIGAMSPDGYLRVFDRKKDMINRGGYKVFSAEVENVLAAHATVAEAAVLSFADPVLGEKILAVVHPRDGVEDRDGLRSFCAARLSDYKVPDRFVFLDRPLPRNANGKLMKAALRESLEVDAGS